MWHHRRPRYHHSGSSTSTATAAFCLVVTAGALRETGPIGDETELHAAWTEAAGTSGESLAAFDDVVGRHREPHRRYHGVRHVTWVVRHVHDLAGSVSVADLGAVTMAAFFHDAVYDPRAADNERQSAALAVRVLDALGWAQDRAHAVASLIAATERHEPTDEPDRAVLLDADLAVLGSEPAAYQAYVTGVRAEYAHVDPPSWRTGRAAVLRSLLDRPRLYSTSLATTRWEARARANMTAELVSLGRVSGGDATGARAPGAARAWTDGSSRQGSPRRRTQG
jgi:predicted metal-dependent HD superfamily phosphohydrolase